MSDYYELSVPHAGALEKRMLYLVHQMTFREFFSKRTYARILEEHAARVEKAPKSITFPLPIDETQDRIRALVSALYKASWDNKSLSDLCRMTIVTEHDVWVGAGKVEEAGIFVPFFHTRDKQQVEDLFQDGFLMDDADYGGWGDHKVHVLFSTRKAGYGYPKPHPTHERRIRTLGKAKQARVIRPAVYTTRSTGTVTTEMKGNDYCCSSAGCEYRVNCGLYCLEVETGGCAAISDECP